MRGWMEFGRGGERSLGKRTCRVCSGLPVLRCVIYGAVVIYARGEEVWSAFLGAGGLDGQHSFGGGVG